MENFEDIKKCWNPTIRSENEMISEKSFEQLIKKRVRKENGIVLQYFWAYLTYQIIIYALASHLIIAYHNDPLILVLAILGVVVYIPFTFAMISKFKATYKPVTSQAISEQSITAHLQKNYDRLISFLIFKKRFEIFAIPVSCAIIILIVFELYVPNAFDHLSWMLGCYAVVLFIFTAIIKLENKKRFELPIQHLKEMIAEMNQC